ncbi:UNVERIFIED_CONTAM: hypothetical protein FKN15_046036 [Acipenser sinensis]
MLSYFISLVITWFLCCSRVIILTTRYQFLLQVKQDVLQGRLPCPFNIAAQLGAYAIQCRYQFLLQVKQDVLQGRLPCPFNIAAQLGAYAIQSELGDYDPYKHTAGYVSEYRFVPDQKEELEEAIERIHKTVTGQVPAEAEAHYLGVAKTLDMYGVDLHPVFGENQSEYFLGLTPIGVVVYKNKNQVGKYFWPRITKVHFKETQFELRVLGKDQGVIHGNSLLTFRSRQDNEMVDSAPQWEAVLRQQKERSQNDPNYRRSRHRSRSKELVDPSGLTEEQLKEIPYKKVDSRTDLVPPLPVTRTADSQGLRGPPSQQKKNGSIDNLSEGTELDVKCSTKVVKTVQTARLKAET